MAIHAHLLHYGKVLFWGRRDGPTGSVNLFCAGHAFLPTAGCWSRAGGPIRLQPLTSGRELAWDLASGQPTRGGVPVAGAPDARLRSVT